MDFKIIDKNKIKILELNTKRIDASNANNFKEALIEASKNSPSIVLDLSKADFLDSSALSALLSVHKILQNKNKNLYIIGLNNKLIKILEITELTNILNIYNGIDDIITIKEQNG
ncbi:MAG: STAS domain-containing protein [Deferribacterota bacterium]|nr:STAS domain-containing protein [Deferribacterota bacterium]